MVKCVLTIAGSDSSGGGGIQADLKTFFAFGVYGMSAITSVTAQNSLRVNGIVSLSGEFISLQIESVLSDFKIEGIKIGMLYDRDTVITVARKINENNIPVLVVDPVMHAKGGETLLTSNSVGILKRELISQSTLVTPNVPEAEVLSQMIIESPDDAKKAAEKIYNLGCKSVLITGGHLKGEPVDVLFDGQGFTYFKGKRIDSINTHGTGCTFSAAITANLVKGNSLKESIRISKGYLYRAIKQSFNLGKGHGPLNHFVQVDK
ncbi:MAG: bifunctional hydroxymethylpyrimidine kinase/phosphomethylpyrimidine kinase [bacterium]